ncbi:MAG: exodeoxyribonuclease VII small subunit [Erysipelothrix sp.]|nr:exodeoxyribonuclease VII small subunit [Erysipelothrix sp.]
MSEQQFDFEKAMNRLNEISNELESDTISLDKAIELFNEGLNLSKACQETLVAYETRVKDLVKNHQEGA